MDISFYSLDLHCHAYFLNVFAKTYTFYTFIPKRYKNHRFQVYSNECVQKIRTEIISLASQFYSRIWNHLSTTEGRIILSSLRTIFFFFSVRIGKTPFGNVTFLAGSGWKKSFYFPHYCHLVDKGNSFRQHIGTCLCSTTRWQHTTMFSKCQAQTIQGFTSQNRMFYSNRRG